MGAESAQGLRMERGFPLPCHYPQLAGLKLLILDAAPLSSFCVVPIGECEREGQMRAKDVASHLRRRAVPISRRLEDWSGGAPDTSNQADRLLGERNPGFVSVTASSFIFGKAGIET